MQQGLDAIAFFLQEISNGFRPSSIYRGHADSTWTIRPSAFRDNKHGITEKSQLNRWKSAASRFANPRPQSNFEWLVLAQHYGVASPLLDWTANPLIALFFACQRTEKKRRGCVIRFPAETFQRFSAPETIDIFQTGREKPGLVDASAMNARTMAQDSLMTLHTRDMPDLVASEADIFYVEAGKKYQIISALKSLGFSADRLYSDINVVAREFSEDLELDWILS